MRIVIFTGDHEPAHVDVLGDEQAKINLSGRNDAPELIWPVDMKRNEVRRAMSIVTDHGQAFLARWRDLHG